MQALDAERCPSGRYDPTGPSEDPAAGRRRPALHFRHNHRYLPSTPPTDIDHAQNYEIRLSGRGADNSPGPAELTESMATEPAFTPAAARFT